MMKGLIHIMKQQLKEIKAPPPVSEGTEKSTGRPPSENRGVVCASGSTERGKEQLRTRCHQSSRRNVE
eukprot:4097598-Prorocentrum_lima.AAC.1